MKTGDGQTPPSSESPVGSLTPAGSQTPAGGPRKGWPLWEVFIRARRGLSHQHVGSLHAPDADMALRNARDVYTRRGEGVSIWVVPSRVITASSPDEKDPFFDPAMDKAYRHPTFYDIPEGVSHLTSTSDTAETPRSSPTVDKAALAAYVLGLGDDALILAQRLGEWITRAPQIEEDIALGNIALDLLGQARTLLSYAGELDGEVTGTSRDEDDLAFLRDEREFRNLHLVEIENGDFALTMVRQLIFSAYQYELYTALLTSADPTLSALATKAVKEVDYHRDHATQWVLRLGDGTPESHHRTQAALDNVWPYVEEIFDVADIADILPALPGIAADPVALRPAWRAYVENVVAEATLALPTPTWRSRGGRAGYHSENLGHLLPEMQNLHRSHPGATW